MVGRMVTFAAPVKTFSPVGVKLRLVTKVGTIVSFFLAPQCDMRSVNTTGFTISRIEKNRSA